MNRDRMRTIVAVLVIASMVLLAAGALGGVLVGGDDTGNARGATAVVAGSSDG